MDAALVQPVISNKAVPERVRRELTVESGLNNGLALPLTGLTANMIGSDDTNWLLFGAKQLVLGPLVGATMGFIGGHVLLWAKKHHTTSDTYEGVGALALAICSYTGADMVDRIGGSGEVDYSDAILHIAVNTVWISALLHGITAAPASRFFGRLSGKSDA